MNETNEHNPDGLTPEQYGAPEWRLLKRGETPDVGDEVDKSASGIRWGKVEARFDGPINIHFVCAYRRRVSPTLADQSARIAELERELEIERGENEAGDRVLKDQDEEIAEFKRRVEELTEENEGQDSEIKRLRGIVQHMDACRSLLNVPDDEVLYQAISQLRAEVERLTKERDVYRGDVVRISTQANALGSRAEKAEQERDNLRAQLAEREEDRAAMDMLELHEVEVRIPLRHGSRLAFRCSPVQEDEGDEDKPSNLRATIRAARAKDGK